MKSTIIQVILLGLAICLYQPAGAQPPHVFTRYTTEDGISQKTVTDMMQDHKGNIWFATWDGINKFDGYTFKNYKAYHSDLTNLTNSRIDLIVEDRYGYIWLRNYDNLIYRFNPQTGTFQSMPYENYQASALYVLPGGDVWISTRHDGLIHIRTNAVDYSLTARNFSRINRVSIIESVEHIAQDDRGNQWILTGNGIYQLPPDADTPVTFFVENRQSQSVRKQPFFTLLEREKEIYFSSHRGRMWRYQKQGGRFSLMQLPTASDIITIDTLPGNRLLLSTRDDGFMVHHLHTRHTEHYNTNTSPALVSNEVKEVYIDNHHEAWLHLEGNGITHFDPVTKRVTYHNMVAPGGNMNNSQPAVYIHEDIHGNLWVHPSGGGFSYYDRERKQLIPFFDKRLRSHWSPSNRMTATLSDRRGNLWLCTFNYGIEKVTFNYNRFAVHSINTTRSESVENEVRAVFEDRQGNIWVGSKDRVIRVYDNRMRLTGYLTRSGHISPTRKEPLGMAYSITQDHKGVIWIGTKGTGIIAATPHTKGRYNLRFYQHNPNDIYSLSDDNVYCVYEDSKGRLWVATYGGGLNYVDYNKQGSAIFINHRNHLKNYPINPCHRTRYIISDFSGNIWVGTTRGLLTFRDDFVDPERIAFNHYTRIPGDVTSLSNNDVHNIFLTRRKELYIATFGGGLNKLVAMDNGKATFRSYTMQDGLPSDILQSIEEDSLGNIWLATEEEICKYTPHTHTFESYTSKFFPTPFRFNEGAALFTRTGKMLFNTNRGFLVFSPDSVSKSAYIPRVVLTQFQLGDKAIAPGDDSHILQVDVDDTPAITLNHRNNSFSVRYAALDMKYPEDILYAYKLQGFEDEWNYVGKRRIATYNNLPKGDYTFMVKSTNSDGVWTDNTRLLPLTVLPSFWETPWAYLIYAFALIAVILTAVYILFTFYRLKNEVCVDEDESNEMPALSTYDKKFMEQLMELMESHMDNSELLVEDLALGLNMSRSVFFKKLKSLTGLSPIEFIKEVRIKRAAELIEEGGNTMAQVAYMVGFNDSHYFSKCFKQVFSMTPTEYKEMKLKPRVPLTGKRGCQKSLYATSSLRT